MRRWRWGWMLLLVLGFNALANNCAVVFQDAVSAHGGGSISFGFNARVINSPDSQLAASSISKNGGSSVSTCTSTDCIASAGGTISSTDAGPFQSSGGTTDVSVPFQGAFTFGDSGVNRYRNVSSNSESTLDFSSGYSEYYFDSLDVGFQNVVNLQAGSTYWIDELTIGSQVVFNVVGAGTAIVYVNNETLTPQSPTTFNSPGTNTSGDASKLVLYAYNNVFIKSSSTFSGILYAQGDLTLESASYLFGSVAAEDITLRSNSTITFNTAEVQAADYGEICQPDQLYTNLLFDQNSWSGSDSVLDTSGNNRHGTNVGGAVPTLTGSCGLLDIPSNTSEATQDAIDTGIDMNDVGDAGTISFWYRSNLDWSSSVARQLIDGSNEAPSRDKHFFLTLENGALEFGIEDSDDNGIFVELTGLSHAAEEWVHVAVTWDVGSNRIQMYTNSDSSSRSTSRTQSNFDNGLGDMDTLYIGDNRSGYRVNSSSVNSADGQFEDFRIYNYVRSAGEISTDSTAEPTCSVLDHIEIDHDGNALTCEAETVTFRACADAACDTPYDQDIQITLSPVAGWADSGGAAVTTATIAADSSLSLNFSSSDPDDVLLGVSGLAFECTGNLGNSCTLSFADTGFQFIGANVGESIPMQVAEQVFSLAQLRAVKSDDSSGSNQCVALLSGDQDVDIGLDCKSPASCAKSLDVNGTSVNEGGSTSVTLNFDNAGFADLSVLTYPDAGEITLSAEAEIDGATIVSASSDVDVRPTSLKIEATQSTANHRAGLPFETTIAAYGAVGAEPLPNYRMGDIQFSVQRTAPTSSNTVDGTLTGPGGMAIDSAITSVFTGTGLTETDPDVSLLNGVNTFDLTYSEVATLSLSVRDADYLGYTAGISGQAALTLGEFIPAYFDVEHVANTPVAFCPTSASTFSYMGQALGFESDWVYTISALNADGTVTQNYQGDKWDWLFDSTSGDVEADIVSALNNTEFEHEPDPSVTMSDANDVEVSRQAVMSGANTEYGKQQLTVKGIQFIYNKPTIPVEEIAVDFNMRLSAGVFTDNTHSGNAICYFETYDKDNPQTCSTADINRKTVSNLSPDGVGTPEVASTARWGRIRFENVFGPENEDLRMQVTTEYFANVGVAPRVDRRFIRNRDDQCTNFVWTDANFEKEDKSVALGYTDITGEVSLSADFTVLDGITQGLEGIIISNPGLGVRGELKINLVPDGSLGSWDSYLQFDWDDEEGGIQPPFATATFGQYRGNDRIIHWREIY